LKAAVRCLNKVHSHHNKEAGNTMARIRKMGGKIKIMSFAPEDFQKTLNDFVRQLEKELSNQGKGSFSVSP